MATLYRTTGIILGSRDHREADRWYTAFTRDYGKVEFLARGARRSLAKLSPHLEMPGVLEFLLVRGRAHETVAAVERRKGFPHLQEDLSRLLLLRNALHLVDLGTRTHQSDPILYDELLRWFTFLESSSELSSTRSGFLLGSFALKLLAITGYRPELGRCLTCTTPIAAGTYRWSALRGGVVCDACRARDPEAWFAARPMPDEVLKLLRFALVEPFDAHLRLHLPGETLAEFHEAIESLLISHFPTIPANSLRAASALA